MSIYILITGGTFDKEYDMINGKLYFDETHIPEMLDLGRCTLDIRVRTLMMIDSLEMTDQDRAIIRDNCARLHTDTKCHHYKHGIRIAWICGISQFA